jgi:hypothetical protein
VNGSEGDRRGRKKAQNGRSKRIKGEKRQQNGSSKSENGIRVRVAEAVAVWGFKKLGLALGLGVALQVLLRDREPDGVGMGTLVSDTEAVGEQLGDGLAEAADKAHPNAMPSLSKKAMACLTNSMHIRIKELRKKRANERER